MLSPGGQPAWAARLLQEVDLGKIAGDIERFGRDDQWFRENLGLFRKDFPGMFIAVHEKRVIASGKTLPEVRRKLFLAGMDTRSCVIRLVLVEEPDWML